MAAFEDGREAELPRTRRVGAVRRSAVEVVGWLESRRDVHVRGLPCAGQADVPGLAVEPWVRPEQSPVDGEALRLVNREGVAVVEYVMPE